jgi:hypothetical protein
MREVMGSNPIRDIAFFEDKICSTVSVTVAIAAIFGDLGVNVYISV